ncbi:hypothetical protein WOLCODRAFT_136105 [Wolfiporia cocos MD-104 SS10]|uniref:Zn(2)-C6 fungal-type domain-containing protein n=1 Tax=Wolfiporia cocos (strain MD-104) TaxID=742152 RepID=A0A2H3JNJ5_WOLCO|nr:hypothetical protein WOLCODRAFT_136105 [Wolfiporia cocos MD-104 SS10]
MSKTCAACRSRKVRCDGVTPTCGPCSKARKLLECEYVATAASQVPKGPLLQKGTACYACRRKKKKCDARRPFCTTCEIAGKEHECQYEENVQRNLTEALLARTQELEERLAAYELQPGASSSSSVIAQSVVGPQPFLTTEMNDFLSVVGVVQPPSVTTFMSDHHSMPDIGLPPPGPAYQLQIPTPESDTRSQSPPELLQLLDMNYLATTTSLHELSEFRKTFISHHGQLGVSLPDTKMQAIVTGDLSGTFAHPVLIYLAQLIGCRLWQEQHHTVLNTGIEIVQLQLVNRALLDNPSPVTRLQVHSVLAIFFLLKRQMREGRDQLTQAALVAVQYSLRFDSPAPESFESMEGTSDETQEHICALSQLFYLDKAAAIVLNDPSLLSEEYERQFRDLPLLFPTISKNNLVVLRARSVALLQQTRRLSDRWTDLILNIGTAQYALTPNAQTQWYDDYWDLLEEVSDHIATLSPSMMKMSFYNQRGHALALKVCMIVSLTASAELHRLLAGHLPESRLKCIDTVFEIVSVTRGLKDEDYIFLDPILGTCWSMVATVINQERFAPADETATLQWKSSFTVIHSSASKLGHALPYMEDSVETINGVAPFVGDPSPSPP